LHMVEHTYDRVIHGHCMSFEIFSYSSAKPTGSTIRSFKT
jgi:hypothetical protein